MIKSDLMKRTLLLFFSLLFLLSACGRRPEPELEHFQGEVVATLQKPLDLPAPEPLETIFPPSGDAEVTPQASLTFPTDVHGGTPSPTESSPQVTEYPAITDTPSLTQTPSATANLTQSPSQTFGLSAWGGTWNIWYQSANGGYTPAELTVQVDGTNLSASAKIEGIDFTFKGEIINEGSQVEGKWQTATSKGSFWWRMNSADTFVGSRENRFGFCGNLATAVQPNPCREVPQN